MRWHLQGPTYVYKYNVDVFNHEKYSQQAADGAHMKLIY